jgi:xylulokinase
MTLLLGIDLGTSSAKALVFDSETGKIVSVGQQEYPLLQPAPMWAEQHPEDWWQAALQAISQCLQYVDRRAVTAIGLTGQMHGGAFLDDRHQPIAPAIIWADGRSGAVAQQMTEQIGVERYCRIAGTIPAAGFLAATLIWLKQNDAALFNRIRYVIQPKDYLRLRLTGELACEISDASATGLFDIGAGYWSNELLTAFDLPPVIFPQILLSTDVAGHLLPDVAQMLDLPAGIPVIAGCADQPAQAITNALMFPSEASLTIGTGGQVFAPVKLISGQAMPSDPRLHVFCHAVRETHYLLGATLSAGLSLRWLRDVLGLQSEADAYAVLSAEAKHIPPGADGLIFLPYLAGERTPHMDAQVRGGFIGLRLHHTRGHLARAVMEGVAFSLRQVLELVLQTGNLSIDRLIASGGALESDVWRQIVTDVIGLPLVRSLSREQTATGAALLAGIGSGHYTSFEEASARTAQFSTPTLPDADHHAIYQEVYDQFCGLYPTLKVDFHQLSGR